MAKDSIEYVSGGTRVRIEGLSAVLRKLRQAGADSGEMSELMHSLGNIVVGAADVPVKSGRLKATLRAGRGKTKAVVRAGFASVPYAGVQHYGWPARNISAKPFLTDALQANQAQIFSALERGIDDLLKKNGLK
jgi:hypothetical protein